MVRALAAVVVCVAALLTGCAVGPSQRPPVAVRGEQMPIVTPAPSPTPAPDETLPVPDDASRLPALEDCTGEQLATLPVAPAVPLRVECGVLEVPAEPGRAPLSMTQLGLVRITAPDAPDSRPPLLALGDSAGEASYRHALQLATQVDPALLQQYAIIGLDRRGAGLDLLDCAPEDAVSALVDAGPPATEPAFSALLEQARSIVQDCNIDRESGLGQVRTSSTTADVEELRAAFGVERLSAIGVGDGATALAEWAARTPGAVARLVLDGPLQPELDQPERGEGAASAAEAALTAFAGRCGPQCALGPDPRGAITALLTRLQAQPLAAQNGQRLTAGGVVAALRSELSEPQRWQALTAALAAAVAGDPAQLLTILGPVTGEGGRFDAELATACNDTRRRFSPGEIVELANRWSTAYPVFGWSAAARLVACAPWPTGGPAPAPGPGPAVPPMLVVGGVADPRATQAGARQLAAAIPTARFVAWQGAGTGSYPRSTCVAGIVDSMLAAGAVPETGILCPP